jgi:hypothetical protein
MNAVVLQETADVALPTGPTATAVLVASLLLTVVWLLYLGR